MKNKEKRTRCVASIAFTVCHMDILEKKLRSFSLSHRHYSQSNHMAVVHRTMRLDSLVILRNVKNLLERLFVALRVTLPLGQALGD